MEIVHFMIEEATEIAVILFEIVAMILLILNGLKGLLGLFRHNEQVSLQLLKGFSEGLTFLLGAEILKTITLQDDRGLLMVAGVTLIRVILSVLIHWEMGLEAKENELKLQNLELKKDQQEIEKNH